MISEPMVHSAQTVHLSCTDTNTVSKWTKKRFHITHGTLEFHRTYLAPTLAPSRPKQDSTWPTSPRSTIGCVQNDFRSYGMFGANHAPILRQDWHHLQMDQNELSLEPHHLRVPLGASKMIFEPLVCNTPGVCHQLSNGFELKHDRSSGVEEVKVKCMKSSSTWIWIKRLVYMITLFKIYIYIWAMLMKLVSCVSHHPLSIVITGKVSWSLELKSHMKW